MHAPEKLVGGTFIALGVAAGAAPAGRVGAQWACPRGFSCWPAAPCTFSAPSPTTGGGPDPVPSIFGYHEVFHTFVGLAAACQYVSIAVFVRLSRAYRP